MTLRVKNILEIDNVDKIVVDELKKHFEFVKVFHVSVAMQVFASQVLDLLNINPNEEGGKAKVRARRMCIRSFIQKYVVEGFYKESKVVDYAKMMKSLGKHDDPSSTNLEEITDNTTRGFHFANRIYKHYAQALGIDEKLVKNQPKEEGETILRIHIANMLEEIQEIYEKTRKAYANVDFFVDEKA